MKPNDAFYDLPDDDEPITVRSLRFGRARILVADDDAAMRTVVADTLETDGYRVRVAASGRAFLNAIVSIDGGQHAAMDGVDLVLLDNRMPGMTGLEALRRMRQSERHTPAILMTAFPAPHVEAEATSLGATVLPKPFTKSDLSRLVLEKLVARAAAPW